MGRIADLKTIAGAVLDGAERQAMIGALKAYRTTALTECPLCGKTAKFRPHGIFNRAGARCPNCASLERHRLFKLAMDDKFAELSGKSVLHFAPEPAIRKTAQAQNPSNYVTADIVPGRADLVLNIEKIDQPDDTFDCVICSHVLEHVNDALALKEIYRILRPGGFAILMVPIIESWPNTYEDATITSDEDRVRHFGLRDHVRYYGRDFRDRVVSAGFSLAEYHALGAASVRYGLMRDETVFRADKPA